MASAEELRKRLNQVLDPELGASIVELGMVGTIDVDSNGLAKIQIALTTAGCPLRAQIERDVREAALSIEAVLAVELVMGVLEPEAKAEAAATTALERIFKKLYAPRTEARVWQKVRAPGTTTAAT